jgi:arabinofuranan 3-O-arabinosyltransferase
MTIVAASTFVVLVALEAPAAASTTNSGSTYSVLTWSWIPVTLAALFIAGAAVGTRWLVVRRRQEAGADRVEEPRGRSAITSEPTQPIWPVAIGLVALSLVIVLASERGWFVSDNRFIWYWNPTRALAQLQTAWDSQPNLGGTPGGQGQLVVLYLAFLRQVGMAPWLAERVLQATFLAIGGIGTAVVAREFSPRSRIVPAVAGLWWLCAPYTVGFLIPSDLYLTACLCPWLVFALIRGTTTTSRWRWSAVFALAVALSGWLNPPALLLGAVALLPVTVYLLATGSTTARAVIRWAVGAGLLIALFLLPAFARSLLTSGALSRNLQISESAQAVSQSSSWSESLRGLGSWLQYWNPRGPLLDRWMAPYLSNPIVIVCSFVPVLVAFAVVAWSRARGRLVFGSMALVSAAVMVGAFPVASPSLYGRLILKIYSAIPATFAFRNSYKAGAGLLLATCILFACGARWYLHRTEARRPALISGVVAFVLILLVSSSPVWSGAEYRNTPRTRSIPTYWTDAMHWLDHQPGAGRAMVVPGALSAIYRWGAAPNGDLVPSLLERPFILDTVLSGASPDAANLITALDDDLSRGEYQPGTFAPIARRLGISYLVIRNDLDWQRIGAPRPELLDPVRRDRDLRLVAMFGHHGENVTDPSDDSSSATRERQLPPVEIYAVSGSSEPVRATNSAPALLVSGDGAAWPSLAADGLLQTLGPVRYTGRLTTAELIEELSRGASVAITDTNRRTEARYSLSPGATLSLADADKGSDLFGRVGSQTVQTFPDATSIKQIGIPQLVDAGLSHRPAAAFDDNPDTSWLTGAVLPLGRTGLEVDLRHPTTLSSITVKVANVVGGRTVLGARLEFPTGPSVSIPLGEGSASVHFSRRRVASFTVVVTSVKGLGVGPYGFSDISLPGLDLNAVIQTPDDLVRLAQSSSTLAHLLASAPLSYHFDRLVGVDGDPESTLRRSFRLSSARSFHGTGTLTIAQTVSDQQIAALIGAPTSAAASSRYQGLTSNSGSLAADGRLDTSWTVGSTLPSTLTMNFSARRVTTVNVIFDAGASSTPPRQVAVRVGNRSVKSPVKVAAACRRRAVCRQTLTLTVAASEASSLQLGLAQSRPVVPGAVEPPVHVLEVQVNGTPNGPLPRRLPTTCRTGLASLDGSSLGVRLEGTPAELFAGSPLDFSLCSTLSLSSGWHQLLTPETTPFDHVVLTASDGHRPIAADAVAVTVPSRTSTSTSVRLDGSAGTRVILGQSYSPMWVASANGRDLGRATEYDTLSGWTLRSGGTVVLDAKVPAQRFFSIAQWLSILALGATIMLIVVDPRSRKSRGRAWATREATWRIGFDVAAVLFALVLAGWPAALLALVVVVGLHRGWVNPTTLAWMAPGLLLLAMLYVVPPLGPALHPLTPSWPIARRLAQASAKLAAVALVLLIDARTMVERPLAEDAATVSRENDEASTHG